MPSTRVLRDRVAAGAVILGAIAIGLSHPHKSTERGDIQLLLDINTAPREALLALPNLGPARVSAIEAARELGPFRSIEDVDRRVKGIGPAIAADLKPHLRFGPEPPNR